MGNYKVQGRRDHDDHNLYITIPSFFRCPISLDVMKSPVSLCTGITYDRSSIQRWLDAGHNVCPATMQQLPPTHNLVPNHTLHRLIRIWSSSSSSSTSQNTQSKKLLSSSSLTFSQAASIINEILTISLSDLNHRERKHEMVDRILKVVEFANESVENRRLIGKNGALVDCLVRQTRRLEELDLDLAEVAIRLLELIARCYNDDGKNSKLSKLQSLFLQPESLTTSSRILHHQNRQSNPTSKIAVADLLRILSSTNPPSSKLTTVETGSILSQLITTLNQNTTTQNDDVTSAYLSCLLTLSKPKPNKLKLIHFHTIPTITLLLPHPHHSETTVLLLESLCGCSEGRKAVARDQNTVSMIMDRILRLSRDGSERCVAILWGLCCVMKDVQARETITKTGNNGVTKLLLMMQSGCSLTAKRMCGDLLRVVKVTAGVVEENGGGCLKGYDSKTSHIMPF